MSIGPFEGSDPGSNPGRDTVGPWGVVEARDPAKVVGQVRLLAGTLRRPGRTARRPAATRQKWVRLPRVSCERLIPPNQVDAKAELMQIARAEEWELGGETELDRFRQLEANAGGDGQ